MKLKCMSFLKKDNDLFKKNYKIWAQVINII